MNLNLEEVNVTPIKDGKSFLGGFGIGHAILDDNTRNITRIRCGIFPRAEGIEPELPKVGEKYIITGKTVDGEKKADFKVVLGCVTAGRPQSIFE